MNSWKRRETSEERRLNEEKHDEGIKENNDSKQSEFFQSKSAYQSETLSSNLEEMKNLDQKSCKNVEQTTLFTSTQPLTSVLRSCLQACTNISTHWIFVSRRNSFKI